MLDFSRPSCSNQSGVGSVLVMLGIFGLAYYVPERDCLTRLVCPEAIWLNRSSLGHGTLDKKKFFYFIFT